MTTRGPKVSRVDSWRPALVRAGIFVGATLALLVALQDIDWDRLLELLQGLRLPWVALAIGLNASIIEVVSPAIWSSLLFGIVISVSTTE